MSNMVVAAPGPDPIYIYKAKMFTKRYVADFLRIAERAELGWLVEGRVFTIYGPNAREFVPRLISAYPPEYWKSV